MRASIIQHQITSKGIACIQTLSVSALLRWVNPVGRYATRPARMTASRGKGGNRGPLAAVRALQDTLLLLPSRHSPSSVGAVAERVTVMTKEKRWTMTR